MTIKLDKKLSDQVDRYLDILEGKGQKQIDELAAHVSRLTEALKASGGSLKESVDANTVGSLENQAPKENQ